MNQSQTPRIGDPRFAATNGWIDFNSIGHFYSLRSVTH